MFNIDLQIAVQDTNDIPTLENITKYAETAAEDVKADADMTVRIVEEEESHQLDLEYRHKDRPTNVLSFPYEIPEDLPPEVRDEVAGNLIGDLVICKKVVEREALEQHKTFEEHWAHMIVHGTLHLLGFDHITDAEAEVMEAKEKEVMLKLGFEDPYKEDEF